MVSSVTVCRGKAFHACAMLIHGSHRRAYFTNVYKCCSCAKPTCFGEASVAAGGAEQARHGLAGNSSAGSGACTSCIGARRRCKVAKQRRKPNVRHFRVTRGRGLGLVSESVSDSHSSVRSKDGCSRPLRRISSFPGAAHIQARKAPCCSLQISSCGPAVRPSTAAVPGAGTTVLEFRF